MIKIDYEDMWKSLKEGSGEYYLRWGAISHSKGIIKLKDVMNRLEKKHTHEYIDLSGHGTKPTTTRPSPKPRPLKKE